MTSNTTLPHVLGIAGSLRQGSYSGAVLATLGHALGEQGIASLKTADIDMPLYNQDLDTDPRPPQVEAFKRAIAEADALLIVTPEYNYGIPGVLKNALDWASRPMAASPLHHKPVQTVSVSPAFTGGVRALSQLHETLLACSMRLHTGPQVVIASAAEKINDYELAHAPSVEFALTAIRNMLAMID